jgi:hypothetical protein
MFDDVDERRKRRRRRKTKTKTKTKDENVDRKRTEEEKKYFKTNVLVPKTTVIRKEEGATVAATPTFSQRAVVRPDRQRSSMETFSVQQESPINYRKCPTNETPNERKT